jgi:hypothetical protein
MGFPKSALEPVDRIILTLAGDGRGGRIDVLLRGDEKFNCVLSGE